MGRIKYQIPDQKSVTYGISAEDIALICRVSFRTACRWKSGATEMPATSKMVLAGDLGFFDPAWSGWMLRCGNLISPENWICTPGEVRALQLKEAQVAALQHRVKELQMEVAELEAAGPQLEEQPLPEQWSLQTG